MNARTWKSIGIAMGVSLFLAHPTYAEDPVSLVGDWSCTSLGLATYGGLTPGGFVDRVTIDEQVGHSFRRTHTWEFYRTGHELEEEHLRLNHDDIVSDDGEVAVIRDTFIGVIGPQPDEFTMFDLLAPDHPEGEATWYRGRIVDESTIQFVNGRPGRLAYTQSTVCERQ